MPPETHATPVPAADSELHLPDSGGPPPGAFEPFHLLVDAITDCAIFMLDGDGNVATWNAGAERLKGYRADEIIGRHFSIFYPPPDIARGLPQQVLQQAREQGRFHTEAWRVRKDGSQFLADITVTAIRDATGRLLGYGKLTRDLTELRSAQEQLQQSEQKFRMLVEGVADYAIFMLDASGRVASWNRGAQNVKGYTEAEALGKHFSIFYTPEDIEAGRPVYELAMAANTGRFEDEGWRQRKDGTRFWAGILITALRDDSGNLVGFGKVTRDLTEHRRREEAQQVLVREQIAKAEIERYAERMSDLINMIAHDARQPITAITASAQMLARTINSSKLSEAERKERTLEFATDILNRARRMDGLLDELVDSVRVDVQQLRVQPRAVELPKIFDDMVRDLRASWDVSRLSMDVPAAEVTLDPDRFLQVLGNLVSNALKYSPATSPVEVQSVLANGQLQVSVTDAGAGIAEEHIERIFQRGYRASQNTKAEGLGLGLYIAKGIARAMGGDITVRSQVGEGSTFTVTLPVG